MNPWDLMLNRRTVHDRLDRPTPERLEELLINWARWCRGKITNDPAITADIGYEPVGGEGAMEARTEPKPVPPKDFEGLTVERAIIRLPMRERRILRVEYVFMPRRRGETSDQLRERRRRALKIPRWQYDDILRLAKQMLANLLRGTTRSRG